MDFPSVVVVVVQEIALEVERTKTKTTKQNVLKTTANQLGAKRKTHMERNLFLPTTATAHTHLESKKGKVFHVLLLVFFPRYVLAASCKRRRPYRRVDLLFNFPPYVKLKNTHTHTRCTTARKDKKPSVFHMQSARLQQTLLCKSTSQSERVRYPQHTN